MAVASEQADRRPRALAGDSPAALEGQGMTKPRRYLTRMGVFLLVAALACGLLFPALRDAFMANPVLNGVILGALLIGIVHIFRTVTIISPEVAWIATFRLAQIYVSPDSSHRPLPPLE